MAPRGITWLLDLIKGGMGPYQASRPHTCQDGEEDVLDFKPTTLIPDVS
jgi:hypothetical protein